MSLYQFAACVAGWNEAHGGEDQVESPGDAEFTAAKLAHGD